MLLDPASSFLAVIDVQERLLAVIPDADRVVARCARLAEAARILGVRAALTEQYPRGLGPTDPRLLPLLPAPRDKLAFSCAACDTVAAGAAEAAAVVLCGLETHVCVAQTAIDLLGRGKRVFVAVDAVASRHAIDHDTALRRLESAGAVPTTSEAILFEWCRSAEHPAFKAIRALVVDR